MTVRVVIVGREGQLVNEIQATDTARTPMSLSRALPTPLGGATPSGSVAYSIAYIYDAVGNRLVMVNSGTRTRATFKAANELLRTVAGPDHLPI